MSTPAPPGYQPDHASAKIVGASLLSVLALALIGAAVVFGLYLLFAAHTPRPSATGLERTRLVPAGPRLESDPRKDRLTLEAAARSRLAGYGWSDRQNGLAHIPIDRAMALQAQKGWPDAEAPQP